MGRYCPEYPREIKLTVQYALDSYRVAASRLADGHSGDIAREEPVDKPPNYVGVHGLAGVQTDWQNRYCSPRSGRWTSSASREMGVASLAPG